MISFGKSFNKSIDILPNFVKLINIGFIMLECENTLSNLLIIDKKIIKYNKGYYLFTGSEFNQKITKLPITLEKLMINRNYPYIDLLDKEKIILSV